MYKAQYLLNTSNSKRKPCITTIKLVLLSVFAAHYSATALAKTVTVYKTVDAQGNVIFSDVPSKNAKAIKVAPAATTKLNYPTKPAPVAETKQIPVATYQSIKIVEPKNEQSFINNQGNITLSVQTVPDLHSEHQLKVLFNGKQSAGPQHNTEFHFSNLFRGSYKAKAQVLNANGEVIGNSPTINFYIRRSFK